MLLFAISHLKLKTPICSKAVAKLENYLLLCCYLLQNVSRCEELSLFFGPAFVSEVAFHRRVRCYIKINLVRPPHC